MIVDINTQELIVKLHNNHIDGSILHLSDNGSYGWGYNSHSSDRDIKGFYMQKKKCYMSPFGHENNRRIDLPEYNADVTLFDIKKFFKFVYSGNTQAFEILASPIKYYDAWCFKEFLDFMTHERKGSLFKHNVSLAKRTYHDRIEKPEKINPKKLLYIIRPILLANEILDSAKCDFPVKYNMNFSDSLQKSSAVDDKNREYINYVLDRKINEEDFGEHFERSLCFENINEWIRLNILKLDRCEDLVDNLNITSQEEFTDMYNSYFNFK